MSAPALPPPAPAALPSQATARNGTGAGSGRRPLAVPVPSFRREPVIDEALAALAAERTRYVARARNVIAEHGLSIEVARLRERLGRASTGDLQRLLLSTPGVVEQLFLRAVKEALSDEARAEKAQRDAVRDDSVDALGTALAGALDRIGQVLDKLAPVYPDGEPGADGPSQPSRTAAKR